jgi:hypothetical protein
LSQRTAGVRTLGASIPQSGIPVDHNDVVRPSIPGVVAAALALVTTACSSAPPDPQPSLTVDTAPADRDRLAGFGAAAKDQRYIASYTLSAADRPDRTVTVAIASDGTWVVGVPGGALSGLADIAIYRSMSTLHQCLLGPADGTAGTRPDLGPLTPQCVPVDPLAATDDPRVQHIFTDWIDVLVDRASAISVAASTLPNAAGACFSVESNATALAPPMDRGVYCYADDGILTGASASFGTLILTGTVSPAPVTIAMPAPIAPDAGPVPVTAPPPPPTPSPSA